MYFLNGDRIYIKPEKACATLDEQFKDCLQQLTKINSGKRIFKLNFFVDSDSDEAYNKLKSSIRAEVKAQFAEKIIQNYIAQPPLTCKIVVEAFFYDPNLWEQKVISTEGGEAALFSRDYTEVLIGNVQSHKFSGCKNNSEKAFGELIEIFDTAFFPLNTIVRKWNYLEDILGFDGEKQRYQEFNDVRSGVYGTAFEEKGYPAATGIGMNRGGVILEFVAVKSNEAKTIAVDNPDQIAAHDYSKKVLVGDECQLKTTPKFERARYLESFGKKLIFISGTASILGEKTVGIGDAAKQTEVTIDNIRRLYSEDILEKLSEEKLVSKYGHARVYVRNRKDFAAIKKTFKAELANLPVVYIIADICRDDLLVEIEGKVILE
jgi:hypothetical protein